MTLVQTAAIVGTILFGLLAILQISLLLGAPLGEFAWGGQQKKLDPNRRVGSGLNIVLYGVFSLMMLARAGFIYSAALEPILPFALWMMVAFVGGVTVFGASGVVLGPLVMALAVALWERHEEDHRAREALSDPAPSERAASSSRGSSFSAVAMTVRMVRGIEKYT
jgi:hypothetical protein